MNDNACTNTIAFNQTVHTQHQATKHNKVLIDTGNGHRAAKAGGVMAEKTQDLLDKLVTEFTSNSQARVDCVEQDPKVLLLQIGNDIQPRVHIIWCSRHCQASQGT